MIKAGIIGGAGYTAGELIRLLINHPEVEITYVASESNAGRKLHEVHTGLYGDTELAFSDLSEFPEIAEDPKRRPDVLFLCMGHGKSADFLASLPESRPSSLAPRPFKIIDLAQDFRDESEGFVYGLPEWRRAEIAGADSVANPGCFATAIQLALLPAAVAGIIESPVNITALTGSTGAGVKPVATTHFSYRNGNLSTYKEFSHQHLIEIRRNLGLASGREVPELNFVPMRGDFARGIFATLVFATEVSQEEALKIYREFYKDAPFTHVYDGNLDLKQVVNTNKGLVAVSKHGRYLHVVSVIDNLLKGASGQALQNMNIMFGLPEDTGLRLKASAF